MTEEEVKRLSPTTNTLRELYLKSGNQCAFPACHRVMIDSEGNFVGQVCHIEAAQEGGERFNPEQTNEERRSFNNIMLMCYEHHTITNKVEEFPVDRLKDIKAAHESKFGDIASKIRESIVDHTEALEICYPKSLNKMNEILEWNLNKEELEYSLEEAVEFASRIKSLPIPTREFLVVLLRRSEHVGGLTSDFGIALSEVKHACDMDSRILMEHINMLDKYGIVMEGDPYDFNGQPAAVFRTMRSGWPIAKDIKLYSERWGVSLTEILVGLRFDFLD